jgi:hypothetical protein
MDQNNTRSVDLNPNLTLQSAGAGAGELPGLLEPSPAGPLRLKFDILGSGRPVVIWLTHHRKGRT